jgi:ligand-binding SRPBCC domain-containing protein
MAIYTLERRQIVSMPLLDCWRFFSDPRNLKEITPPSLGFRVRSELPAEVYPGLMIEYTVAPVARIPIRWLMEIVHVNAPHHFVDEQRVGPYRLWHHEHFFRAAGAGEVEVCDLVHYVPPFGPLGVLVNALVIRPQLERIFDYRRKKLETMAIVV